MSEVGEYGSPMHLRAAARMLTQAVQEAMLDFGSDQYASIQQKVMAIDMSWKQPAKEWEQVRLPSLKAEAGNSMM